VTTRARNSVGSRSEPCGCHPEARKYSPINLYFRFPSPEATLKQVGNPFRIPKEEGVAGRLRAMRARGGYLPDPKGLVSGLHESRGSALCRRFSPDFFQGHVLDNRRQPHPPK
jgi:hypothetical protein